MASLPTGVNGVDGYKSEQLIETLSGINADRFDDDGKRIQALLAAYGLVSRLATS